MNSDLLPPDETDRLQTLWALNVLDSPTDPVLDGLVRSAAIVLGCPISAISLTDETRQWFKARIGLNATEIPRELAFCAHAILDDQLFEVPDAALDSRFANSPLVVGEPHVRFYAGVPLGVDGYRIGTLCVIDRAPRLLDAVQRGLLIDLARAVEHWLVSWRRHQALHEAETYRRSLFEQLGDGVLLLDREHRVHDANPQALVMLGYGRDEILALHRHNLLAESEHGRLTRQDSQESFGKHNIAEWQHVRRDGSRFHAEVCEKSIDDYRYLVVMRDVSSRHAQDQQLRQLSLAVEQSSESIIISDLVGNIEYVNAATEACTGYSRSELIGRNLFTLQSSKAPAETFRDLRVSLAAERFWKGLLVNRRKDGTEYVSFASVTPVRMPHGKVTHYLTVMGDVSEKQRMVEELARHRRHLEERVSERTAELELAMQAAEAANKAKSAFLASMSHEIRTPMNGVVGIVDVLRQSSLTPYQSDLADTIRESAFALLGIIDDILDFSKIEAGHLALECEPVALQRLIEGVCDGLQPTASNCGVGLQMFVDPQLPEWIIGDAVRLRQILNNLLGNAIKFSAGFGHAGLVRLRAEANSIGQLSLQVSDNGIGMEAEAIDRIFVPFMQAESSTTRRYGGTGLGLSICRRLVELFSGGIEVASEPGRGATFTVTLPLHPDLRERAQTVWQDLSGLECHVVLHDDRQAQDWCTYLRAAGASARAWSDLAGLRRALSEPAEARRVALVEATIDDKALDQLQRRRRDDPVLAVVRIGHGRRRLARRVGPDRVSLDADAMHRAALLRAVALAAGLTVSEPDETHRGLPIGAASAPTVEEAAAQGRLILVVEDNDINQKVIRQQLALLGLACEVAGDGLHALELWRKGTESQRHGLLLTDLHMPGLDGYELTANIRSEEKAGRRLPIVALTANALRDEAERCRSAGMDDYLSKPVQLPQLSATLARWLSARSSALIVKADPQVARFGPTGVKSDTPLAVLDSSVLPRLIGDDPDVLADFRRRFMESALTTSDALHTAVAQADWKSTAALGHRLKSSAAAVGALALSACCDSLERASRRGGTVVVELLNRFDSALAAVAAGLAAPALAIALAADDVPEAGVVLVDDEPFQLDMLRRQLATLGVTSLQACKSGALALEWLRDRDTSALLLLLDLNMPGMDGVEFMRHLAEGRYSGGLALVSGTDERVLETATKLGAAYQLNVLSHLQKPVTLEALRVLLMHWHAFIPTRARQDPVVYSPQAVRHAIDAGELLLHFQPKVSMSDGALIGVESLVRWRHSTDGLVFPDSFISVAEANDLIDDLTRNVLTQSLAQSRRWRDEGLALRVAVNISMENLARLDFPEFVVGEAVRHGVPPADLVLEVTESRLMVDMRAPMDILTRLRLKQVGLSIDDFGTGHSSLAQLRDMPFDELKIDRGFVHGVRDHVTQSAIFTASLEMAHQLGMKVVAEGVEDRADWEFARSAGCDVAQGYFVARPMPAEALKSWAATWQQRFEAL